MNSTQIAIDIAKNSFHVCTFNKHHKVIMDRCMTRAKLKQWLANQKGTTVTLEACGSAHYWARYVRQFGHTPKLIPPKSVTPFRQGHKTDRNDTIAIGIASHQPNVKSVAIKTVEQQGLQSIERIRQHLQDTLTATGNMIRGLIYEFGITIAQGVSSLKREIPFVLEDAENELPMMFREQLANIYQVYLKLDKEQQQVESTLLTLTQQQSCCKRLTKLEGVGPVNALGLYLALGARGESFKNGREASACLGLTPKQYSTGGKVILGSIGKHTGNKRLRSSLIQGAMAVVRVLNKREARNTKEDWLKKLIKRCGLMKAAVALANKTVRTAWALLNHNSDYQKPSLLTE